MPRLMNVCLVNFFALAKLHTKIVCRENFANFLLLENGPEYAHTLRRARAHTQDEGKKWTRKFCPHKMCEFEYHFQQFY